RTRHVARRAIAILRVVPLREPGLVMALQAFAAVVFHPFRRRGVVMRILTRRAGEPVAGYLLALALQQSLPLACRPSSRPALSPAHKKHGVIEEIVARTEVLWPFALSVDS